MNDLRTAAQQALVALEYGGPAHRLLAIHALRAALAEPVQEPAPLPLFPPVSQWGLGCAVCGIGAGCKAYGYVCPRSDCPTRVTCGGVA